MICFAGGEDKDGSFSTVERYDPQTDSWCYVTPMIRKRAGCGVTVYDGKLYVAGQLSRNRTVIIKCFWNFVLDHLSCIIFTSECINCMKYLSLGIGLN